MQYVAQRRKKSANTHVLGMVANGMDACVNMSCSMSFAQCVVQTGENTVNTSPPTLGACWMVAEGGEGENPLPFSLTAAVGVGGWFLGEKAQAPGGPGPKPWGPGPQAPWRPGPQAPGAWIPPLSPVDFLQAKFSSQNHGSGSQNATITPSPLTLGGVGWFPKAELYSYERRGSRLRSSISAAGPGPKPLQTWPTSP